MRKILVIQLARMGDLLQSSPLIQAIRERRPGAAITLLSSEKTKEIARMIPGIDEVLGFDFGEAYEIVSESEDGLSPRYHRFLGLLNGFKGRSFDDVYNLNHSGINANLMNLIEYRNAFCYGLGGDKRKILKNQWLSYLFSVLGDRRLNRFNLVDIYLHGSGLCPARPALSFQAKKEAIGFASRYLAQQGVAQQELLIGFQLGAGDPIRCWPIASYARLADLLLQCQDARILLFGSPSEREMSVEFQARFSELNGKVATKGRIIDLVGKTTFDDLAAFLQRCNLLVTPDTGTMHLATAIGTRVFALFMGSAFGHETGPYGDSHLVLEPNAKCYPCFQNRPSCTDFSCKRLISPEAVANVVQGTWQGKKGQPTATALDFSDARMRLLQSQMRPNFVEYVPVGKTPFSTEDVISLGYRAMWQRVLDDDWNLKTAEMENPLGDCVMSRLSQEETREIRGLERDFERLQSRLEAGSASSLERNRCMKNLVAEEERGTRWIKPIARFLHVEEANIQVSGKDAEIRFRKLLSRLARGAGFMKAFLGNLSKSFRPKV